MWLDVRRKRKWKKNENQKLPPIISDGCGIFLFSLLVFDLVRIMVKQATKKTLWTESEREKNCAEPLDYLHIEYENEWWIWIWLSFFIISFHSIFVCFSVNDDDDGNSSFIYYLGDIYSNGFFRYFLWIYRQSDSFSFSLRIYF